MCFTTNVTSTVGSFAASGGTAGAGELLQLMRDGTPRTRAELIRITGLARSTVGARVDALLAAGLLTPVRRGRLHRRTAPGPVRLQPGGRRRHRRRPRRHPRACRAHRPARPGRWPRRPCDIDISDGPGVGARPGRRAGRSLLSAAGRTRDDLAGVGIGLPGPVEHSTGRPMLPPIMPGWDGYDVPGHIDRALGGPVLVDNDVNLMALGEHATVYPDVEHLHLRQGRHRHRRRHHQRRPAAPRRPGRGRRPRPRRRAARWRHPLHVRQRRLPRGGRQRAGRRASVARERESTPATAAG